MLKLKERKVDTLYSENKSTALPLEERRKFIQLEGPGRKSVKISKDLIKLDIEKWNTGEVLRKREFEHFKKYFFYNTLPLLVFSFL